MPFGVVGCAKQRGAARSSAEQRGAARARTAEGGSGEGGDDCERNRCGADVVGSELCAEQTRCALKEGAGRPGIHTPSRWLDILSIKSWLQHFNFLNLVSFYLSRVVDFVVTLASNAGT